MRQVLDLQVRKSKVCPKCRRDIPLGDYRKNRAAKDGLQTYCADCGKVIRKEFYIKNKASIAEYWKIYYRANREKVLAKTKKWREKDGLDVVRHKERLRAHGMSEGQYKELFEKQGGACAICRALDKQLVIDHDHRCCKENSCGKCVRGLICKQCNHGLGLFLDNPSVLLQASAYLRAWDAAPAGIEKTLFADESVV